MSAVAAIVESEHAPAFAAVRAAYSAYREAEVQREKAEKRLADAERIAGKARALAAQRRLELGRALLAVHKALGVRQGDRSGRWAAFLAQEGIPEENARRWMKEADSKDSTSPNFDFGGSETPSPSLPLPDAPHPAEMPEQSGSVIAPAPRKPLGLLADMQLLVGRWEDVLSPDEIGVVDTIITDPPFSERTHRSAPTRDDGSDPDGLTPSYPPWTKADVDAFVDAWSPRCRGWMVCLCDHTQIPWYEEAYERNGRFAFAPVPCIIRGMSVRTRGDGPSSEVVYAMVARPRTAEFASWGTLQGYHYGARESGSKHGRGKPRWLMDELVREYSRENDLVCDPLAGYGVTLVSAILQRRRAIGAEVDPAAVDEAFRRVAEINEPSAPSADEPAAEPAA